MRCLGVDFGGKRIGIAVGDAEFRVTSARPPLGAAGDLRKDALAIAELARREGVDAIVVGIPFAQDSRMQSVCLQLAERIREQGLSVQTVDESFTSIESESNLRSLGGTAAKRRRMRDGEAARLILERFFETA